MTTVTCPWCDTDLELELGRMEGAELDCTECSTSWLISDPAAEELALAA